MHKPTHAAPRSNTIPTSLGDYVVLVQVGEGTYGRVYKARHKQTNKLVALKVLFNIEEDEGISFTAVREIKYLQMLSNQKNIIKLEGTFFSPDKELVLVFEYMEHDLSGLLSLKHVSFSESERKCIMKQLLEGLDQIHISGIMHRDIKAANLLMGQDNILKIADFGLATNWTRRPEFSTNVVTLWYRAPELLLGATRYNPKVDIWSAGCIFIELLTRRSPFPGKNESNQMDLIFKVCGTPTEENFPGVSKLPEYSKLKKDPIYVNRIDATFKGIDPLALDLLKKMLTLDPEKRITASEALDHDYFWTDPMPCPPSRFPKYPAMHEFEAKRNRNEPVSAPVYPRTTAVPPPVIQPVAKSTASSRFGKPSSSVPQNGQHRSNAPASTHNQYRPNLGVRPEPMKRPVASRDSHRSRQPSSSHRPGERPSSKPSLPVHNTSQSQSPSERRPPSDHHETQDTHHEQVRKPMLVDSEKGDLGRKRKREICG